MTDAELTQEEIDHAGDMAWRLAEPITTHAPPEVIYMLWMFLTEYLTIAGWTPEELSELTHASEADTVGSA